MNLHQLEENFESLAAEDPLWTVLSDDAKRGGKWDLEEFYTTGRAVIDDLESRLDKLGKPLGGGTAIDFGCGVGRLTFPLSQRFQTCYGIDISCSMVEFASTQKERGTNCTFTENTTTRLHWLENASIDLIYSAIVFQHIAPRYTREYLKEFSRLLKPGGLLVFQLPSHLDPDYPENQKPFRLLKKRLFYQLKVLKQRIAKILPFIRSESFFEMNAIHRDRLAPFLHEQCGLEVLDQQDFPAAGLAWKSYLYITQKGS